MTETGKRHTPAELRKRAAVLAAITDASQKGKLNLVALFHGMREQKLATCVANKSLRSLSQFEIDWLAVDLLIENGEKHD